MDKTISELIEENQRLFKKAKTYKDLFEIAEGFLRNYKRHVERTLVSVKIEELYGIAERRIETLKKELK